jgi:tellurite resistance protein
MISTEAALIYTMVIVSASDSDMTDPELMAMGDLVRHLPVFIEYQPSMLLETARSCADILSEDEGMATVLGIIKESIPETLYETAYAIAIEVAAADGNTRQEELRILELLRHHLGIERLIAAGIERGAPARFATL